MSSAVAVVTGGSHGIGFAIAERLVRRGLCVTIVARHEAELDAAVARIRSSGSAHGGSIHSLPADLAVRGAAARIIAEVVEQHGRLDVLVNNAGYAPLANLSAMTDEAYDRCAALNMTAVFEAVRAAWPTMCKQRSGLIVNLSSQASRDPFTGFAVYGASKAWVNLFTRATAAEGRVHGIRVYAVAPGAVETRMLRENFPKFPREQTLAPEDVAAVVEQCLDDPAPAASGETIFLAKD